MTVIIYRWIEVYPEKMDRHCIMHVAHDVMCTVHFFGYTSIQQKIMTVFPYHIISEA